MSSVNKEVCTGIDHGTVMHILPMLNKIKYKMFALIHRRCNSVLHYIATGSGHKNSQIHRTNKCYFHTDNTLVWSIVSAIITNC